MKSFGKVLVVALLAFIAGAPALAADRIATLQVKRGSIMADEGGQFVGVSTGKVLVPGQRMMVTEASAADLVFSDPDGDNRCVMEYNTPGVYVVNEDCRRAAVVWWPDFGILLGSFGIGAAILASMDRTPGIRRIYQPPAPPISR